MTPVNEPSAEVSAQLVELTACMRAMRSEFTACVQAMRSEIGALRSEVGELRSEVRSEADSLRSDGIEVADAAVKYAYEAGRAKARKDPTRPVQIATACAAPSDAELQRVDVRIGDVRIVRGITPGSDPDTVWPSMQAAAADVPKNNRPRVNRRALPGREYQHRIVDGHLVAIDLGAELSDLEARQVIRAAEAEHGLRRTPRRLVPLPLGLSAIDKVRSAVDSHTVSTVLTAALIVGGGAVGLGLYLSPDDDGQRRTQAAPPTISATRNPGAPTPAAAAAPRRSDRQPARHPARLPAPAPQLEVRPAAVTVAFRPKLPRTLPLTPPRTIRPRVPVPALPDPGPDAPAVPTPVRCLDIHVGDLVRARLFCPAEAT